MAENEPRDLHHLAGLLHPYSINQVREVLLPWLRDAHDVALANRAAGARGRWRFVKDRHNHLVHTAPLLRNRLTELRSTPGSLLLTIKSTGVLLYPFQVHRGSFDPLLTPDVAYTREFLSHLPEPLNCLVLLPWADVHERIELWAGGGESTGDTMTWNWRVSLTNETPDIPPQATYPYRVRCRPPRDRDTEDHHNSLADER